MKPRVFIDAARIVEDYDINGYGYHACSAILNQSYFSIDEEFDFFKANFSPLFKSASQAWFGPTNNHKNQQTRVIALLLAAEMVKK